MSNTYRINQSTFLEAAHQFVEATNQNKAKEEFNKDIEVVENRFNIIYLAHQAKGAGDIIISGRYNGWDDLKYILTECTGLLDHNYVDIAECIKGLNAIRFEVVTAQFHIKIQKDLKTNREAVIIKRRV